MRSRSSEVNTKTEYSSMSNSSTLPVKSTTEVHKQIDFHIFSNFNNDIPHLKV